MAEVSNRGGFRTWLTPFCLTCFESTNFDAIIKTSDPLTDIVSIVLKKDPYDGS